MPEPVQPGTRDSGAGRAALRALALTTILVVPTFVACGLGSEGTGPQVPGDAAGNDATVAADAAQDTATDVPVEEMRVAESGAPDGVTDEGHADAADSRAEDGSESGPPPKDGGPPPPPKDGGPPPPPMDGGPPGDAGPLAALCAANSGMYDGGICTIPGAAAGPTAATCPPSLFCVVDCTAPGSCMAPTTCGGGGACTIECGSNACLAPVKCTTPTCTIECEGSGSCTAPVVCTSSGTCCIACSGGGSCGAGTTCNGTGMCTSSGSCP